MGRLTVAIGVMAGLVPAIHVVTRLVGFRTRTSCAQQTLLYSEIGSARHGVDGRDKPGHDGVGGFRMPNIVEPSAREDDRKPNLTGAPLARQSPEWGH
jgi:hypothetical protein